MTKSKKNTSLPKGFIRDMPPPPITREQEIKKSDNFTVWDTDKLRKKMDELNKEKFNNIDTLEKTEEKTVINIKQDITSENIENIVTNAIIRFFDISNKTESQLKGNTALIFLYILKLIKENNTNEINVSIRNLAKATDSDKNTVLASLEKLEKAELITRGLSHNKTIIKLKT